MRQTLEEARRVLDALLADAGLQATIGRAGERLVGCYQRAGKILICGNGGSACDAMHFAEELTGRFRRDRRPLPAIALGDAGHLTCTANDYGFEFVFSRLVEALGARGDVLIVLSTSGNSPNLLKAADAAKTKGVEVVGLLGKDGGALKPKCDHAIVVPGQTSDRIQELHMLILHGWVEAVERGLGLG